MSLTGTTWSPIGPSPIAEGTINVNGLVSAIAVNQSNPNIIYMGTAGGGVWRSNDGGLTWIPIFDRQLSLAVGEPGALAIDPNNSDVVYVGTSARVAREPQAGLFKSIDDGASWIQLGSGYPAGNTGNASQFINQWINVIIVDPANSNIVYLGSTSGMFRSTDGGFNWTKGANSGGDVRSLVLDTSTPLAARILYIGVSGRGVFISNDGGQNWNQVLSGATPVVNTAVGAAPNGFNKVIVSIAPPTAPANAAGVQVLYVSLQGTGGAPDPVGVFLSTDQGATWTQRTATGMPTRSQGGYSFHMAVDPGSPGDGINDIIYFGAVGQARSTDSGNTFTGLTGMHADTHAWAFVPQPSPTPSIAFCGNDGGLYRSTNGGGTWVPLTGGGLQTGLFYNIDMRPDATGSVTVGALQDNEVESTAGAAGLGWIGTQGGDGWDVAYDGIIAGQVYCTSGFWSPAPCTRIHRSTDDGATFPTEITPWGTATDAGCYLAPVTTDPSTGGIVYVSGNQNLWQSRDGGGTWRILSPFATTGNIDVAKSNGNNVVIGVGSQVFVSSNALAATVGAPTGVIFTNITRNLPPRNIARAIFDPNDPTIIYAVLGGFNGGPGNIGHVFRTSIGASAWTDISPALNLPFSAIALDGTDTPTSIYTGTEFGVLRSVDGGGSWAILDDIHFPRVPVLDLIFRNGILRAATYGRGAFSFVMPKGPVIAVDLEHEFKFGSVCQGPQYLSLKIFNVGVKELVITSVQRLIGSTSFSVISNPGTPLILDPGEDIEFTVAYNPSSAAGLETATIRIISNDPLAPFVDLTATGTKGSASMATVTANSGNFGNTCPGSYVDEELTINNNGSCPLLITNITSSSAEFMAPGVVVYPLVINAGCSLEIFIRFQPASFGAKSASLRIFSNDPGGVRTIALSGAAAAPRLNLILANTGNFGSVCIGSFRDETMILNNSGPCALSVSSIISSNSQFIVPQVSGFPILIAGGNSLDLPIRFQPVDFGPKAGVLTFTSDDPASPGIIDVSGYAPSGKLAITGSLCFGGVKACCRAERTLSICNVGDCNLHVTSVGFKRKNRHWKLVNNPFPATLHPGSCLGVVIRYKATEKCPRCCELIITSDDPDTPVKTLDVMAYTIWNSCGRKQCCDDCKKGCCNKQHTECCEGCADNCCDDDHHEDD